MFRFFIIPTCIYYLAVPDLAFDYDYFCYCSFLNHIEIFQCREYIL